VPKEDTTPYTLFGSYVLFVPLLLLLISALARSRKERP